jgi:hypothetical protein
MIENIQHEFFIWEEKNSTEPKTKLENNGVNEEVISTNEIKNDSTQKDWKDITEPKERKKAYKKFWAKNNVESRKKSNKKWELNNKNKIKIYNDLNKNKIKNRKSKWYSINKNRLQILNKEWRLKNKDGLKKHRNSYNKIKESIDVQYKLSNRLRSRLNKAINRNFKAGSAVRDLGCTVEELKPYLESKFQPGMTWDNWTTDGWHIDHIKPLASFDLTDRNQLLEACHYTNLQPLWAKDNLIKSDKLI